jgi:antitoxin component HigA of HigAB toxin-antitoxin module
MEIRPIKMDQKYQAALDEIDALWDAAPHFFGGDQIQTLLLDEIDALWDAAPGSGEADRLEIMATLASLSARRSRAAV